MRSSARAVVIGGGVGGCSILYWLARLGWDDVVLVERADLTSGSTFHSAGLVGQLRSSLALTRMMMNSVELYRTLEAEVGLETGWREVGSLRLASSPERLEEITRQAGWAKTFGLPLELISAAEAQALFPPMSTDGVLGAAYLPSDGYIDPSQLTFALAEGARRRGAEVNTRTRVTGITVERGEVTGVETDRGVIETGIVINAGGMYAREIGALAGRQRPDHPDGPRVPRARAVGPADRHADDARSVAARLLPARVGRPDHGRLRAELRPVVARRDPGRLQRQAARGGLAALRGADGERDRARADARGDGRRQADQRPRGVHARRGVHPRPVRRARLLGRRRASARTGSPARAAWGSSSRSGSSTGRRRSTSGTWTRAASAPPTARASTRSPARRRSTRRTTTSSTRGTSARPAGRCASRRPIERLVELGAAFGEKSGWERANWFEPNAARGDESLRPRGWAGKLWSPAIGVEHRACREAVARVRRVVVREDRRRRARCGGVPRVAVREPGRARGRRRHLHADAQRARRDRVRLHGDAARRGALPDRHRNGVRPARPRLDPPARAARRLGARRRRDLRARLLRGLGAERPRAAAAADDDRPLGRRLPLHAGAGALDRRRALPRRPGHVRRRARLGALLPGGVRGPALGHDLGGRRGARPRRGRATRRSTRCGSRRATASGAPTSRRRSRRSRPGSASRSSSTRAPFLGRDALLARAGARAASSAA